jgi:alanine-synthesizing transaminase
MFSSRTQWNLTPNRLSEEVAAKRLHGDDIVDLTESNPTQCGFSYPEQEILSALAITSSLSYQPDPRGLPTARKAITDFYATRGIAVSPEHIFLTASTSEAYSILFKLLCDAGEEILIPQPSYPLIEYLCQLNDVVPRYYRLAYDGEWHIDFEYLEAAFTDRTRAIVLVHPNNPTGSYLKQDEFSHVSLFAAEHGCALIVDEVFETYSFSSDSRRADILKPDTPVPLFSLNGISKLLGLPQLKLSWIVVRSGDQYREEIVNRLDIIADTFLSVNTPVQVALPGLLNLTQSLGGQIILRVHSNYRTLREGFSDSSVSVLHTEGGWYAVLQFPLSNSDDEWALELLRQQNILVYPGHFFEMEQPSCIVLSLLPPSDRIRTGISKIRAFLKHQGSNINPDSPMVDSL